MQNAAEPLWSSRFSLGSGVSLGVGKYQFPSPVLQEHGSYKAKTGHRALMAGRERLLLSKATPLAQKMDSMQPWLVFKNSGERDCSGSQESTATL